MKLILILKCFIFLFYLIIYNMGENTMSKKQFALCVQRCANQFQECANSLNDLFKTFNKNKKQIRKLLNNCCIKGEKDLNQPATLSFATCTRINCAAELWG